MFAHRPGGSAVNMQGDDVPHERGAKGQSSRAGVGRLGHAAAGEELLHGELDVALELDGAGHVYHGAGLGTDVASRLEVHVEDGIGVTMGNVVVAAGKGAAVGRSFLLLRLRLLLLLRRRRRRRVILLMLLLLLLLVSLRLVRHGQDILPT